MRWLLHGNLAPAVAEAVTRRGHQATWPQEVELAGDAPPADVLKLARTKQLDLLTADAALVDAIFEQKLAFATRTVVLLAVDAGDVEQDDAVDRLFERYKRLATGRLYTVTRSRVKIRQLPTT